MKHVPAGKSKYHNRKATVEYNGKTYKFDSQKEARRFSELLLLLRGGKITELELQPVFPLLDTLKYDGIGTLRKISYIADFRYKDSDGNVVVEDVKGYRTDVYRLKLHLFLERYGNEIKFREIT